LNQITYTFAYFIKDAHIPLLTLRRKRGAEMNVQKVLVSLLICLMLVPFNQRTTVKADELVTDGKSAILLEAETGVILYEKDAHKQLAPASMTKMMSMYLILEAINDSLMDWDEMIQVSDHAAGMGGSQVYLKPGEEMSVEDLFKSVAIASANDSVVALGERVAGSEARFVEMMNEKAQELGMVNTLFKNPTGLSADGHLTTSYDMAVLARHLLLDFPEVTEFTQLYEDYIRQNTESPFWLVNTNKLVRSIDGVDGLKTGFTQKAGYCLTATAKRDNMRVIAVVMGSSKSDTRNQEVAELIEYAYSQYELVPKMEVGTNVASGYNMLARDRDFSIVTAEPISVLKAKTDSNQEEDYKITLHQELELPIKPGDEVGRLVYYYNGEEYQEIALTVSETVEKNSFIGLFTHIIAQLLFGENA